ncbi:MAG: hypothetical protein LUB59_05410, partial [Candidatus Gastranaerophilales bacterium]|nr:hypothetical protein [Candidatus Gastranaerophilales bacterium]
GGSGENVDIDAGGDVDAKDITANDDINIDAGGDVTGDGLTADDDNDGVGDVNINAGGDVNLDDTHGNKIVVDADGDVNINNSSATNGIYYNGINVGDGNITAEVLKNLNNLQQSGVNTTLAQSFTPIAFAADDDDDEQSVLAKKIAKSVFKNQDGTISITDRFDTLK